MNDIINYNENEDKELYEVIAPYSRNLATTVIDWLRTPNDRKMYAAIQREAKQMGHIERMKILEIVDKSMKYNNLSDERFNLLMTAFAITYR
jgi:hypothetical protein